MNIYQTLFDIINTYIFGDTIVSGTYQELVAIICAVSGCLFVFWLPFKICQRCIETIFGGFRI